MNNSHAFRQNSSNFNILMFYHKFNYNLITVLIWKLKLQTAEVSNCNLLLLIFFRYLRMSNSHVFHGN